MRTMGTKTRMLWVGALVLGFGSPVSAADIQWVKSFSEAQKESDYRHVPILVDFTAVW